MPEYRGFELPRDFPLIMTSSVQVLRYTVDLWVLKKPLPKILGTIEARAKGVRRPPGEKELQKLHKIWRVCGFFLCRCLRSHRPCLRRSLVLHAWARKRGIDTKFFLGVKKEESLLKGHAWLNLSGSLFRESRENIRGYKVMLEG
ncbi:MAG: lasso peptide biosynthesis B2 protein [Thermovirgaceae bacterium]